MFIKALLIGMFYWVSKWSIGYTFGIRWAYAPMIMGPVIGLFMGDVVTGTIMGAYIQAVYLGLVTDLGGVATVDKSLATCIAIPVAMQAGLSPEIAVTLAIPFGLLGTLTTNIFKIYATWLTHKADEAAEQGNAKKIRFLHYFGSALGWLPLALIPVTTIVYAGPEVIQNILAVIPDQIVAGLSVVGGILPALGFAMTIRVIGRKQFLPFFFLGFFLVKYFAISTIGASIFGIVAAIVYVQLMGGRTDAE